MVTEGHYHSPLSLVEVAVVTLQTAFSLSLQASRGSALSCTPSIQCLFLTAGLPEHYDESRS